MNLADTIKELRKGAWLQLSFAKGGRWHVHAKRKLKSKLHGSVPNSAIKRRIIVGAGDALFPEIRSQVWRYNPTALNWKQLGKRGAHVAMEKWPAHGHYVIRSLARYDDDSNAMMCAIDADRGAPMPHPVPWGSLG